MPPGSAARSLVSLAGGASLLEDQAWIACDPLRGNGNVRKTLTCILSDPHSIQLDTAIDSHNNPFHAFPVTLNAITRLICG